MTINETVPFDPVAHAQAEAERLAAAQTTSQSVVVDNQTVTGGSLSTSSAEATAADPSPEAGIRRQLDQANKAVGMPENLVRLTKNLQELTRLGLNELNLLQAEIRKEREKQESLLAGLPDDIEDAQLDKQSDELHLMKSTNLLALNKLEKRVIAAIATRKKEEEASPDEIEATYGLLLSQLQIKTGDERDEFEHQNAYLAATLKLLAQTQVELQKLKAKATSSTPTTTLPITPTQATTPEQPIIPAPPTQVSGVPENQLLPSQPVRAIDRVRPSLRRYWRRKTGELKATVRKWAAEDAPTTPATATVPDQPSTPEVAAPDRGSEAYKVFAKFMRFPQDGNLPDTINKGALATFVADSSNKDAQAIIHSNGLADRDIRQGIEKAAKDLGISPAEAQQLIATQIRAQRSTHDTLPHTS